MNLRTKIYLGIAAAALIAIFGGAMWQSHTINKLENAVRDAKQAAAEKQDQAAAIELDAAEYKQKIEYLEQQLAEIQLKTRKQDEKLERTTINSRDARDRVERAKRAWTIDATAAELCAKLAELGHACG